MEDMFKTMEEFNLLLYVVRFYDNKDIAKMLGLYADCPADCYTESFLVTHYQLAAAEMCRIYPETAGTFTWEYFYRKRTGGTELEALFAGFVAIPPSKFSDVDQARMVALREKYVDPILAEKEKGLRK